MQRKKSPNRGYSKAVWTDNQKLECVTTYMVLGKMTDTAVATGIPIATVKRWRYEDWFKDLMNQIREEDKQALNSKLAKIVDKTITHLEDRIEHGDFKLNQKTGKVIRVGLSARDALKVTTELMTKQEGLTKPVNQKQIEQAVDDRLAKLAAEFARFAQAKDVTPAPVLIEQAK